MGAGVAFDVQWYCFPTGDTDANETGRKQQRTGQQEQHSLHHITALEKHLSSLAVPRAARGYLAPARPLGVRPRRGPVKAGISVREGADSVRGASWGTDSVRGASQGTDSVRGASQGTDSVRGPVKVRIPFGGPDGSRPLKGRAIMTPSAYADVDECDSNPQVGGPSFCCAGWLRTYDSTSSKPSAEADGAMIAGPFKGRSLQRPGIQPPGIQPPGTQPTELQPPELQPTEPQPPEPQPPGTQPPGTQPPGTHRPGTQRPVPATAGTSTDGTSTDGTSTAGNSTPVPATSGTSTARTSTARTLSKSKPRGPGFTTAPHAPHPR
jgi:hypothetical protein